MYDFNGMPDGMDIKGTWYNKRTGKTITVRDMYMDDSGMQVMTNTGEMIDGDEFSRDYIQCDATVYDNNGNSTGQQEPVDYESMFNTTAETVSFSDSYITTQPVNPKTSEPANKKYEMLNTMFDKLKDNPVVSASIKWKNIPKSELNMLKMYFDITTEDIADYIYKTYCSEVELKFAIEESIKNLLNKADK